VDQIFVFGGCSDFLFLNLPNGCSSDTIGGGFAAARRVREGSDSASHRHGGNSSSVS